MLMDDITGTRISAMTPFGFEYKGYRGDSWVFEGKQKNVVQTMGIYETVTN